MHLFDTHGKGSKAFGLQSVTFSLPDASSAMGYGSRKAISDIEDSDARVKELKVRFKIAQDDIITEMRIKKQLLCSYELVYVHVYLRF